MTIFQDSILVVIFILLFVVFLMICALIDCVYRAYQAKKHRQHNIFEIGDLYVFTEKYSKQSVIHKVDSLNSGKGCIRHATDAEIKAGCRL